MSAIKIREYRPEKPGYGQRLTLQEWERLRPVLTQLSQQGLSRHDVVRVAAEQHGFQGTYAALNRRFKDWGLTNPRSKDDDESTNDQIDQEDKPFVGSTEHFTSSMASGTNDSGNPSARLITPKDRWRSATFSNPAQRSGDDRDGLMNNAPNAWQTQQTTDASSLMCIANNEELVDARAQFPYAYGSERDSCEGVVASSITSTPSGAAPIRSAADEINWTRTTHNNVQLRLNHLRKMERDLNKEIQRLELEKHLQRQQETIPESEMLQQELKPAVEEHSKQWHTQYAHREGLRALPKELQLLTRSVTERTHHRSDTRPTSTSTLRNESLETHAREEDTNEHTSFQEHEGYRHPQSKMSASDSETGFRALITVATSSSSTQSWGKSKPNANESAKPVEQTVPTQDGIVIDSDNNTDMNGQRSIPFTSSKSLPSREAIPAPIHTESEIRRQGREQPKSRETITLGHDESPESKDEHWRTSSDVPVGGHTLFGIHTVEPQNDPRGRVLQSSEVANDSRYAESEMVSSRRSQLDDHEREPQCHTRVSDYYQPQAAPQPQHQPIAALQEPMIIEHYKRTRSEVSTLHSSRFSFTSSTQSFAHFAKRLRQQLPDHSFVSLTSSLSAASTHSSQAFGAVTGFGPDLSQDWYDEPMDRIDGNVVSSSSATAKRQALEECLGREVLFHEVAQWRRPSDVDRLNIHLTLLNMLQKTRAPNLVTPFANVLHLAELKYVRLLTKKGVNGSRLSDHFKSCIYIDLGYDQARTFVMLTKSDVETWLGRKIEVLPACDILPVSTKLDHLLPTKSLRTTLERKVRYALGKDGEDKK